MQLKHAGSTRGIGVAVVALSAAALALCLLCAVGVGLTGAFFDSSLPYEMARSGAFEDIYDYSYGGYGISGADVYGVVGFLLIACGVLLAWEGITCVLTLIAGIFAMKYSARAEKLDKIFVWGIVGAVAALLGGRLITMTLLIIVAVFSNSDRNAAQTAHWQAQGPAGFAGGSASGSAEASAGASAQTQAQGQSQAYAQAYAPAQPSEPKTYPQPSQAYQQVYGQPVQGGEPPKSS